MPSGEIAASFRYKSQHLPYTFCISSALPYPFKQVGLKKTIYSNEYAAFRKMLRATRVRLGMSQEELGKKLGRHQPFIARIETGQRRLDVVEFVHFMRAMGVSPNTFLKKFVKTIPEE